MSNIEIRRKAKENGVHLWRIADALGITDGNFSRKLRKELSEAEKEQIFKIIDDLKECDKNDSYHTNEKNRTYARNKASDRRNQAS